MQSLAAVAEAVRIAITFALLVSAIAVVSLVGITCWALSSLVTLLAPRPAPFVRPEPTSTRG